MDEIKVKIIPVLILLLGLLLILNLGMVSAAGNSNTSTIKQSYSTNAAYSSSYTSQSEGTSSSNVKNIKVLIYNGQYSIGVCVSGIKSGLNSANSNNLVPGYHFTYATATVINSRTLAGYDVLAMPGGADGDYYVSSNSISGTAIRNFVANGKGYLGICAGAYSGVKTVISSYHGNYNGWGVAPHVKATRPWVEGEVPLKISLTGQKLFGYGGTIMMAHYNGPAMYASGGCMVTFATYADNRCNSKGLGAIVGDYYGKGRSVIAGPHPELEPTYPDILANLVVWAANKSTLSTSSTNKASMAQICSAAASVKTYYESKKVLPSQLTINGNKITIYQFLYLLVRGVTYVNAGSNGAIFIRTVNSPTAASVTYKSGTISKKIYLSYAQTILTHINKYGQAPNYLSSSLGKIPFSRLVYMYSKIMNFYRTSYRLPNYVSI